MYVRMYVCMYTCMFVFIYSFSYMYHIILFHRFLFSEIVYPCHIPFDMNAICPVL